MDDLDDAGRLDPGLPVHLDRDPLLPEDGDLHLAALRRSGAEKQQLSDVVSLRADITCFTSDVGHHVELHRDFS